MNWAFHLDDLSDDMDDKSTGAIADVVMSTYQQPRTYDPKSHVGKLTKRFTSLTYIFALLTIQSSV